MSATDRNERRIARMSTWISHAEAEAISGEEEAHIRFLFYWIAYEAAYQMNETGESEGGHRKERREFHRRLASHDRGRLQSILRAQKDDVVSILELRQAHPSFWKRWDEDEGVRTVEEWESAFRRRVGAARKRLDETVRVDLAFHSGVKEKIAKTLDDVFQNLNIVRNQIVHGASAGRESRGRTQVILGARLLSAFVPCFRDSIKFKSREDWGEPPFPRVGSGRDDKCPPPWLSWQPGPDPAQGAT